MSPKPRKIAKLSRPRLHGAVARERLFSLLDQKRHHSVVWVAGQPGSGKTTLLGGYLDATRLPALWFQIDPGDSDPATFFYYLRQAIANRASSKSKLPPLFTEEYLPDLAGYARRFFRSAFLCLESGSVVVLDNYHELSANWLLHSALATAIGEIPESANVMVASRTEPLPSFAEARLRQAISLVSWSDLKLTDGSRH